MCAIFALFATMIGYLSIGMTGGSGVVLNATSGKPVAAATVRLECRDELFHGARVLKELRTTTDTEGKFVFGISELWRCDSAFVHPEMAGFVDTSKLDIRYGNTQYRRISAKLYLTPSGEERLQRIKYHFAMSKGHGSSPTYQYFLVYEEFFQAKRIAQTEADQSFVRTNFCERLSLLNAALSNDQRDELRQGRWNTATRHEPVDHEANVVSYCLMPDA